MVLVPTRRGTSPVFQFVVPDATPDRLNEVDQVTCVGPTLSEAVPRIRMVAAVVETLVDAGEVIFNEGRTLSVAAA